MLNHMCLEMALDIPKTDLAPAFREKAEAKEVDTSKDIQGYLAFEELDGTTVTTQVKLRPKVSKAGNKMYYMWKNTEKPTVDADGREIYVLNGWVYADLPKSK